MSIFFVIGTGRSGTHWVGRVLDVHPDIVTTIEEPKVFHWVTRMALDPEKRPKHLPDLISTYRERAESANPKHYADKSHPNLWLAEALAEQLPEGLFVGIERSPYATVASMLKHSGVQQWIREWRQFPVPNDFLGITEEIAARYDDMSLEEQCALRWRSHHQEMQRIRRSLDGRALVLVYEGLIDSNDAQLARLWDFLTVRPIQPEEPIQSDSRDRWRSELDARQIDAIRSVTGIGPDDWSTGEGG